MQILHYKTPLLGVPPRQSVIVTLWRGAVTIMATILFAVAPLGCSVSDFLDVAPPAGVQTSDAIQNASGAALAFNAAKAAFFGAMAASNGFIHESGLFADEFGQVFAESPQPGTLTGGYGAYLDARVTTISSGVEGSSVGPLVAMLTARSSLLLAAHGLTQYGAPDDRAKIGEALVLVGYTELLVAEMYCAGLPLSQDRPGEGVEYGMPLTTDSLLATAVARFDSALALTTTTEAVRNVARIGRARALLDRGHFEDAATAAAGVPTDFVYNIVTAAGDEASGKNLYQDAQASFSCAGFNVSDREGSNGLPFVAARDPRLVIDSTRIPLCGIQRIGQVNPMMYYPLKFGTPATMIPLASGLEARLIEAEADLHENKIAQWANALNTLRTTGTFTTAPRANPETHEDSIAVDTTWALGTASVPGQQSGVRLLDADSTTGASSSTQIDVMFHERAFWLFGTASRTGDLRRLVRQYGRTSNTVYPIGTYMQGAFPGLAAYGEDVSISLPTPEALSSPSANPNYRGCIGSTTLDATN